MCSRLDVLLSYDTPKILQIQDRRVGLCYYGVIGLIFCYVFFFMVLWRKRYLLAESPSGSVRFSLLQPAVSTPVEQLGYCRGGGASNSSVPCLYWDESDVVVAGLEEDALLITTRLSPVHQQLPANCTQRAPGCRYRTVVDDDSNADAKFFVADIERFTLMIEHSYEARAVGLEGTSVALPGEVADEQGQLLSLPNSQVGVAGQQDIFTVADLLAAAGIASLDSPSLANPARTMRDDVRSLSFPVKETDCAVMKGGRNARVKERNGSVVEGERALRKVCWRKSVKESVLEKECKGKCVGEREVLLE